MSSNMAPRFAQSTRFLVAIVGLAGALSIFLIEPPEFMTFVWIAVVLVVTGVLGETLFQRMADRNVRARDLEERKNQLP
jgi:hypothetical protein